MSVYIYIYTFIETYMHIDICSPLPFRAYQNGWDAKSRLSTIRNMEHVMQNTFVLDVFPRIYFQFWKFFVTFEEHATDAQDNK